jgi:hypothetical protein
MNIVQEAIILKHGNVKLKKKGQKGAGFVECTVCMHLQETMKCQQLITVL